MVRQDKAKKVGAVIQARVLSASLPLLENVIT